MINLAVTTSTATVGVAVGADTGVLASEQMLTDRRHAEELAPMIQRVVAQAGVELAELSHLVVDVGPGRFTGLRVGLATVRTLALILNKKVVPLSSLEILAAAEKGGSLLAVVDARRGEVFQQQFAEGKRLAAPTVGPPVKPPPGGNVVAVGDGADRYPEIYTSTFKGRQVQAAVMLSLADPQSARPGTQIEPLYLREPDVNLNLKTRPHAPRIPPS